MASLLRLPRRTSGPQFPSQSSNAKRYYYILDAHLSPADLGLREEDWELKVVLDIIIFARKANNERPELIMTFVALN